MNKKKVTNKRLLRAAYLQAGHTVAYILTNRPFEYVTIKPDSDTLGYIQPPINDWAINLKSNSFYVPSQFNDFFEYSFMTIAGFVAEKIFGFSYISIASQLDFQSLHVCE